MNDLANADQLWHGLLLVAAPIALFTGYRLLLIERREKVQTLLLDEYRGAIRINPRDMSGPTLADRIAGSLAPIIGIVEQERLTKLLIAAGLRGQLNFANFIASKAIAAALFMASAWIFSFSFSSMLMRIGLFGTAFFIGWRIPDVILSQIVKRRRLRLERGMPDALDLLVVCAEAGLSLNQSIDNISRQLVLSNKDIANEFAFTSAEMQVLPDFGKALDNLVERTGLVNLRSLVATLKQSLKLGTPLAESLRMIASEMRAERNARMEERAAKLPVLLSVPMMVFILPCLLMVVGTPVAIRVMDTFKNVTIGHQSVGSIR